jgi:hypothetical protein
MPARTIVCPDCGEAVPRGRLSCPACGALLASVTGGDARPAAKVVEGAPDAASVSAPEAAPESEAPNEAPAPVPIEALSQAAAAAALGAALDDPSVMAPARIQTQSLPETSPDDASFSGSAASSDPGPATPMPPSSIRQTELEGSMATTAHVAVEPEPPPEWGYVPPGTPPPSADTLPGPAPMAAAAMAVAPAASAVAIAAPATGVSMTVDRLQAARMLGYATAAGAGLVVFGMLMPLARVVVGANGGNGLFDTWGLAGPGHILVFLWAMAVLAVSILPTRIPVSIRSGLAGMLLGVFCLGLVWPYIVYGPMGAGIGAYVIAIGALVLTVAGITSAWLDRHAADERSV